jgi:hypothetical protein
MIFRAHPDRSWGPPSLLYNEYWVSFPEIKQLGRGVDHPMPFGAEVKKRVELYLFSPSGPSWPVLGKLYLHASQHLTHGLSRRGRRQIDSIGEEIVENVWT